MFDDGPAWEPGDDISRHQTAFATALRVPILSSSNPEWQYVTGIVVGDGFPDEGQMPTDSEIAAVAGLLGLYCERWYNQTFRQHMLRRAPYDIDGRANLGYLIKYLNGGWAYRKKTWREGAYWAPPLDEPLMTLEQVIARMGY